MKKNLNYTFLAGLFTVLDLLLIFFLVFTYIPGSNSEIQDIKVNDMNMKESIGNPIILMKTSFGDIKIELYEDKAPITVDNFLSYVEDGFYENTVFHRVIEDFMVQGGGFVAEGTQKETKSPIKLESDNGLKNLEGTIAMARTNVPDSATSQFFINVNDNSFLDYSESNLGYAVFGKVIEGMQVVKNIETVRTSPRGGHQDWPLEDITIISVEIVE